MDKSQKIQPDGGAPRVAEISRITKETEIFVRLNLDGQGEASLDVPIGFMVHMLNTFARHGLFDLEVRAKGDLEVDQHHLVEDLGIVLGQCFSRALGDKRGIRRTGSCLYPMDETLARAAVDLSGRAFIVFEAALSGEAIVTEVGNADKEGGSPPLTPARLRGLSSPPPAGETPATPP
jgi:imidazoleglycerol-phosphate dehydratase